MPAWQPALHPHLTSPYKPSMLDAPALLLHRSSQDRSVSSTQIAATRYLPVWWELGTESQSRKHFVSAREENMSGFPRTQGMPACTSAHQTVAIPPAPGMQLPVCLSTITLHSADGERGETLSLMCSHHCSAPITMYTTIFFQGVSQKQGIVSPCSMGGKSSHRKG